jgi:hypothetical protein
MISMVRDPDNEFDSNCVKVFTGKYQIGCIDKQQAIHLSPLLDTYKNKIISNIRISEQYSEYHVLETNIHVPDTMDNRHRIEDIAFFAPFIKTKHHKKQKQNNSIPVGSSSLAQSNLTLARKSVGEAFDEIVESSTYILPTDEFFQSMSYGEKSDDVWYYQFGLRAPIYWQITAPTRFDTSSVPYSTNPNIKTKEIEREKDMIDKINCANGVWHADFVEEIIDLLRSPNFFSQIPGESITKKDQLIAVYGGLGYVLGIVNSILFYLLTVTLTLRTEEAKLNSMPST